MKDSSSADSGQNQLEHGLEQQLRKIESSKLGRYERRTEHIDKQGNTRFINRLIREDSPYLLQHAHNPVNWYAWGEEAFTTAKQDNKPIFLSIGYSTCHWCHVMEVESFDNIEVAKQLNKDFISIKLDREQHPDIDEYYMTGVQLVSGQGGWPMSNFMVSDGRPFFGATYFPAQSFLSLLSQISETWKNKPEEIEKSADSISQAINRILAQKLEGGELQQQDIQDSFAALLEREDKHYGGLSGQPKFPQEPILLYFLEQALRYRDTEKMAFVDRALEGMARGGIYDQVGGGFHRYSTDSKWLVPHFEKMLYNQSQLSLVYLQAFQATGKEYFLRIVRQTLDYVLRDMQLPDGGFYSATDADSEGEEGLFFVWTLAELHSALNQAEFDLICSVYSPSEYGNFEGSNILCLDQALSEHADSSQFYDKLDQVLNKLYQVREERIHPLRDDKLIVSWTSAMASSLLQATIAGDEDKGYLEAAEKALNFIWKNNLAEDGNGKKTLKRIYLNGTCSIASQLEDFANLCQALLLLFDVSQNRDYLQKAALIMDLAVDQFWDQATGGFFIGPDQAEGPKLIRSRSASDGAVLSPVAVSMYCLLALHKRSKLIDLESSQAGNFYQGKLQSCIASISGQLNEHPLSYSSVIGVVDRFNAGVMDLIQYAGQGYARVRFVRKIGKQRILITIDLQAGWHITANQQSGSSSEDVSQTTALQLALMDNETYWQLGEVNYPAANHAIDDIGDSSLAVYQDSVEIEAKFSAGQEKADLLSSSIGIELQLQLCNENSCLLAERLTVRL